MNNGKHQVLSALLTSSSRALAGFATEDFLSTIDSGDSSASVASEPPAGRFSDWQRLLAERLEELSAAVALESPGLFSRQVQWVDSLLAARDFPHDMFRRALTSVRKVLSEELSADMARIAQEYIDIALDASIDRPSEVFPRLSADSPHGRLAMQYLVAVLEGDNLRASKLILDRARAGDSVPDLYLKVLLPSQEELGRMWFDGEINIAEEHAATSTTRIVFAQLRTFATFRPRHGKSLLAATVVGNHVDLGLQVVGDFFEMYGWRVIQLGSDVPVSDLVEAIEFFEPDVLGLSAALTTQLPSLGTTIDAVRQHPPSRRVKILIGGRALLGCGELAERLGADAYAVDPIEAVETASALVGAPPPSVVTPPEGM